ncbi:MAG: class I SAM-dependent methyltransferase [Sphingomonas sp.]|nr:class I SAM-dependent methyltransferase [Sphingomonas sp.]
MRDSGVSVGQPIFVGRDNCIACGSSCLREVAGGSFSDDPLRSFISADPWGENPLPVLAEHRWSLVECECGQRFHRNILSPQWNEVRFSRWMSAEAIDQFEAEHGCNPDAASHVQHVLRLKALGVERVLDFGCGFGRFLEMCCLFGLEAHGVDRSNARRSGANVQIHAELDEAPGTYDAITMFEVLEHLDDPLAMLKTLRGRLNPGGVMVVEVPDTSDVDGIVDRRSYHKIHPLDHINAFTPESLVAIMGRAGFEPIAKRAAFVTTSLERVAKDVAKASLKQSSTQRYFRVA